MEIKKKLKELLQKGQEPKIVYYPEFDSGEELTNHYFRACWYFPAQNNHCKEVHMYRKAGVVLEERPKHMGSSNVPVDHIKVKADVLRLKKDAESARVVLVWKKCDDHFISGLKQRGITIVNVDTNDENAVEYGRYCDLIWRYFKSDEEKKTIIQESYNKFVKYADKIKEKGWKTGCVFGTGPSLETAEEFDFTNCVSVVCNSIVQNDKLLSHIKPQFVTAGDVVSHLGVSLYAETFRRDLINYLKNSEAYYLTTAPFGYLLLEQCSEVADKIILAEQIMDAPNFDLIQFFGLPKLDSTFNIHMLPLIHTFCDNIFILGCDGKSKTRNNEDFWAHAQEAQYFELVQTGHICHPTFDINRKKSTYNRYQDSVLYSVMEGEKKYGKKYYTLQQSYIDALEAKRLPDELRKNYNEKGQLILSQVLSGQERREESEAEVKENIKITREKGQILVSGWVLSKRPCRIAIYVQDIFDGYAVRNLKRPDIQKKYPEYGDLFSGIYYYISKSNVSEVSWKIMDGMEIIKEAKQSV